ncbi:MAG: RsmG family class I SAM-dependent methyltransferase [Gracilimonas sp.]|nr:RsmG family class I SAM-dependent methyltransferase [Gracilimonas sp.]
MKHEISYKKFNNFGVAEDLLQKHSEEIRQYVDQLLWWNERVNLISRDVSRETIVEHVRHSLVIASSDLFKRSEKIIDAGTGGGLPGIPLAIAERDKEIVLNDIVSKKIMACKQMVLKLQLNNCTTVTGSIADLHLNEGSSVVTKHAFKIYDLIGMIREKPWLGVLLLKGENEVEKELKGVAPPLKINVFSLEQKNNPFYDGKALVEITRL